MKTQDKIILSSIGILSLSLITIYRNRKKYIGGRIRNNKSNKVVFYKPEESNENDELKILFPKETPNEKVDGISTELYKDKVFKVPDLCCVDIEENGEVTVLFCPAQCLNSPPQWLGIEFLNQLHNLKDYSWDKLFQSAKVPK